jgi:GxxExxY protein
MIIPSRDITKEERQHHIDYVYEIVGYAMDVCKQLPCSLPEYIYQEAFAKVLRAHNIDPHKEFIYHPHFDGKRMKSYIRTDFMVERQGGNIIVEAKAIDEITRVERAQLFGYMVATEFPYGLLVNFANYPRPKIERYYFDKPTMTIVAF